MSVQPQIPASTERWIRQLEKRVEKLERRTWPKQPANADTAGATLAQLETEVNQLKQLLRDAGLMA